MITLKAPPTIGAALLALCLSAPAQAAGINRAWVSGHGTDAAGCGSPANPCRSLQYVHDNIIAAGGEIDILDPAGYGAVTISKALSIVNDGVGTAGVQEATAGAAAITFNGGTNDTLTLRGLNIDGLGTGGNGIVFNSGAGLTIVNCVIQHFPLGSSLAVGNGILIAPTSGSMNFVITNTIVSDNGLAGIAYLPPSGTANTNGVIDHVVAANNQDGIAFNTGSASGGTIKVSISNSIYSNNSTYGMIFNGVTTSIESLISNSNIDNNGNTGIAVVSANIIVNNCTINQTPIGIELAQSTIWLSHVTQTATSGFTNTAGVYFLESSTAWSDGTSHLAPASGGTLQSWAFQ